MFVVGGLPPEAGVASLTMETHLGVVVDNLVRWMGLLDVLRHVLGADEGRVAEPALHLQVEGLCVLLEGGALQEGA